MSLRSFTVFQDAPASEPPKPKITRPNAMVTRSQRATANIAGDVATSSDVALLNKENYNPVTGERAVSIGNGLKKRKITVLATKVQIAPVSKMKKGKEPLAELEPERKKHKVSTASASKAKATKKEIVKGSSSVKKSTIKRTGLKKVTPLPKLPEEEDTKTSASATTPAVEQVAADARCYELTVQPLADVSQAYEEVDVFSDFVACATSSANAAETNVKFSTVKESSVEPEIRDYYQPPVESHSSNTRRLLRALSQDPAPRTFSTPERRRIYSAFTFSSPSAISTRPEKVGSTDVVEGNL